MMSSVPPMNPTDARAEAIFQAALALSGQLFYSTQIPVCLWSLAKNNAVACEDNARLFGGETNLSLVTCAYESRGH